MMTDLLWVTNIATPYRAPLWAELGQRISLTVALLAETEHNRQWSVELDESLYNVLRCEARPLCRTDDTTFYGPSRLLRRELARRPRAVVLDGWESPAYLAAMAWCRIWRVPVFASYRSTLSTHRYRHGPVAAVRSGFLRSATGVLTAGAASTEAVSSMRVPRQRVTEGFNSVDVARIASDTAAARRRGPAFDAGGHSFLYVGMLIDRKNVDGLLHAFAQMREPLDRLSIVGDGPRRDSLASLSGSLNLSEAVDFVGHLQDANLTNAYAAAHTLVLPSHAEVWGLVVNEALAAGLNVVVSDVSGVVPDVRDLPGVFVTTPAAADLARAMGISRAAWSGHREDHPILQHTPAGLAGVILDMIGLSL